jgi:hypothetical protein
MGHRRDHYERAFEAYLRSRRIPYVSIDEARKTLLPDASSLRIPDDVQSDRRTLKSFDFVVYGDNGNHLIDVKGRKIPRTSRGMTAGRLESWVTQDDVESLRIWEKLFGEGFTAGFVFIYWCVEQPPDALFQEIIEHRDRWYALRAITLDEYTAVMKPRSVRWKTVHLSTSDYDRVSTPFCPPCPTKPRLGPMKLS